MSSGDQPAAKKARRGLCQKPVKKAKKAPLDDLPSSGDEDSGDDIVQAGLQYNKAVKRAEAFRRKQTMTDETLRSSRATKAMNPQVTVPLTAADTTTARHKSLVKTTLQRGLQDPDVPFVPARIDLNDIAAVTEAKLTTNMLLKRMKREPKLCNENKTSEFVDTAEEYSDTMATLITIVKRQAEKEKESRGVKRKEKA